jgi:competence protein ComEC
VSAAVAAAVLVLGAALLDARRRSAGMHSLAVAALGAGIVAVRLAAGMVASGGTTGPGTVPLPQEAGTWRAAVAAVHTTNGQQIATLSAADPAVVCASNLPAYPRLAVGDTISWKGRFRALSASPYDQFLASQGVAARCEAMSVTITARDESLAGRLERIRESSGDALQVVLPEPEGGLAAAILIGLRDRVDKGVAADFTTAGVSHIVAISGWNISIVAATISALLGGLSRRRRSIVIVAAIVAYTSFAGASPSVVRAALMATVGLLAVESGRGSRVTVGLAWAITAMLVVDPGTVGDVGFQLSAAATAGLVTWAGPLTRRLDRLLPWLPGSIRESLGVSFAAQVATLPLALLVFGRLAPIAPAANLVAVPLVPPAMAAGAVAFAAGWLAVAGGPGWLAGLLAMPAWALLAAMIGIVHLAASVPGANATLPFPANAAAALIAALGALRLHRSLTQPPKRTAVTALPPPPRRVEHLGPRRRLAVLTAAFLVALSGCVVSAHPDGAVHIIVLDVGQGDSILLEGDRGSRILVDGGPDGSVLMHALDAFVPPWDRRLNAVVLTHPHDDHDGGLAMLMARYRVARAFESGWPAMSPAYRAWSEALQSHGVALERLRTGNQIRLDGCTLRVLWPDDGTSRSPALDPAAPDNRKTNDASIVMLGDYENHRFLLAGDAEDDVDPILLSRGLPTVDMLKVAHHGSATASSAPLLAAIRPAVAVVSVGAGNTYGHPAPSTMSRLRAAAGEILTTERSGSVEVTLDAAGVRVRLSGESRAAIGPASGSTRPVSRLLYDSIDVRSEPWRERGLAAFFRSPDLAPAPFSSGGGDSRLAGPARGIGWAIARSPPG